MLDNKTMRAIGVMLARQARTYVEDTTLPSNEVIDLTPLLKNWAPGAYEVGQVISYEGEPYRCIQTHDSTENPEWTPRAATSIWATYHATDRAHALSWRSPVGAHDAYNIGEWMIYTDGIVYECLQDATVWGPDIVPNAWRADDED